MALRAYICSVFAGYCLIRGKREAARKWFDRYFAMQPSPNTTAMAQEAFLCILEGRSDDAKRRFAECLKEALSEQNGEEGFVATYCRFWLTAYDPAKSCEETLRILANANASKEWKLFKANFILPSLEAVRGIKQDQSDILGRPRGGDVPDNTPSVSLDF